jgi:hypothetical protein
MKSNLASSKQIMGEFNKEFGPAVSETIFYAFTTGTFLDDSRA